MDQSEEKSNLPDLPPSEDAFWKDAVTEKITLKDPRTCAKGEHRFIYKGAHEAQCEKCLTGYFLSPGMEIKDGHMYAGELLLL